MLNYRDKQVRKLTYNTSSLTLSQLLRSQSQQEKRQIAFKQRQKERNKPEFKRYKTDNYETSDKFLREDVITKLKYKPKRDDKYDKILE